MTRTSSLAIFLGLLASAWVALPASAQTQMYPGQGITMNPGAIDGRGDGRTSPYAGNGYPETVHLHMPKPVVHHRHVATKPKPSDVATAAPAETMPPPAAPTNAPASNSPYPPPLDSLTDTSTPPPAPAQVKHKHHAQAAAAPAASAATDDSGTGSDAALPLTLDPQDEHPVSQPPKHKHADAAKPEKTASIDTATPAATTVVPAPSSDVEKGLTRRSEILFPRGDPDVSSSTVDKMRTVAADLNTLLGAGASRVQLDAYGGAPGDKGSDARRLSLKRALGIRQLLIEDGVPAEKIDVRALGGIDDSGAPDRVDVLVRGG
jgi:outer membrane protein OmpA-like peptidoglycan-associated protein